MARKRPAKWMQVGATVDYRSVIGGEVTEVGLRIKYGPRQLGRGGPWFVRLDGKSGRIPIEAITRAADPARTTHTPNKEN